MQTLLPMRQAHLPHLVPAPLSHRISSHVPAHHTPAAGIASELHTGDSRGCIGASVLALPFFWNVFLPGRFPREARVDFSVQRGPRP